MKTKGFCRIAQKVVCLFCMGVTSLLSARNHSGTKWTGLPFYIGFGPSYAVPLNAFASDQATHGSPGFSRQNKIGFMAGMSVQLSENLRLGTGFDYQQYQCDPKYVAFHMQEDWDKIDHKQWTYPRGDQRWKSAIFDFSLTRRFYFNAGKKLFADIGGSIGVITTSSPEFICNADVEEVHYQTFWDILFGSYSTTYEPRTELTVHEKNATSPIIGLRAGLGYVIRKRIQISLGSNLRYTRQNFHDVRMALYDGSSNTNPGKVDNFVHYSNFRQPMLCTSFNLGIGLFLR